MLFFYSHQIRADLFLLRPRRFKILFRQQLLHFPPDSGGFYFSPDEGFFSFLHIKWVISFSYDKTCFIFPQARSVFYFSEDNGCFLPIRREQIIFVPQITPLFSFTPASSFFYFSLDNCCFHFSPTTDNQRVIISYNYDLLYSLYILRLYENDNHRLALYISV